MENQGCLIKKASNQSGSNYTSSTVIAWDAEIYDTYSCHDTVTNNSRITIPSILNGVYAFLTCTLQIDLGNPASGQPYLLSILKGGALFVGQASSKRTFENSSHSWISVCSHPVLLATADYFEVSLFCPDTLTIIAANSSFGLWVPPGSSRAFQGVSVHKSVAETGANYSSGAVVAWDAEDYDTDTVHDTVTNNSRLTIPSTLNGAWIIVGVQMTIQNQGAGTNSKIVILKNGSDSYDGVGGNSITTNAAIGNDFPLARTQPIQVTTGDYFEAFYTSSDTSIDITTASSMWLYVVGSGGAGAGASSGVGAAGGIGSATAVSSGVSAAVGSSAGIGFATAVGGEPEDDGWTAFTATEPSGEGDTFVGAGTRLIYVSQSTGSDSNDGTVASPYLTIAKGVDALRNGKPDWLLLKEGDTWTEQFGHFTNYGLSSSEPMVISSYHPSVPGVAHPGVAARPLLKTDHANDAFACYGGLSTSGGDNCALVGIEFYCYTRDPGNGSYSGTASTPSGLFLLNPFDWFLLEGNKFSFYAGLTFQGPDTAPGIANHMKTVTNRRNVIVDNYSNDGSHAQGVYCEFVKDYLDEENVYDHNGWNATVGDAKDIFKHNLYVGNDTPASGQPCIIRNSIFANGCSNGIQGPRTGGTVYDCLLVHNPIGCFTAGSPSTIDHVVCLEGIDIDGGLPRGWGIELQGDGGDANPSECTNNIVAHVIAASPDFAIRLNSDTVGDTCTGNIVYQWGSGSARLLNEGTGNTVSGNTLDGTGYTDATRSVGSYAGSLGFTATLTGFLTEARKQSKNNWRTTLTANAVNNYIREGFDMAAV